jgi:hypothetical protein
LHESTPDGERRPEHEHRAHPTPHARAGQIPNHDPFSRPRSARARPGSTTERPIDRA